MFKTDKKGKFSNLFKKLDNNLSNFLFYFGGTKSSDK